MKIKEAFYLLGLRPKVKNYGHRVDRYDLQEGDVEYANWLHPKQQPYRLIQREIDFLRSFIHAGDCAIDIGARTGDTALPIGLACGPSGKVLAFEPNPHVYPILEINSRFNTDRVHITPYPLAITEADGEFVFEYSDSGYSNGGLHMGISPWQHGHAFPLTVKGVALEPFLTKQHPDVLSRLRYIKIDVEGYDLNVLKSMRNILANKRPYIRTEVYKWLSDEKRHETFRFLSELGYSIWSMDGEYKWRNQITEADMYRRSGFDIYAHPQ